MDLKARLGGKFIVFDGPDGCGKTTQLHLAADLLAVQGLQVIRGKDPGGTPIGERIRSILLDYDLADMDVRCETFLFMASRAQLAGAVVEPALRAGQVVLCDRFISSTWAYQGAAGYDVSQIVDLGRRAVGTVWPDLTLIFDLPAEEGFRRIQTRAAQARSRSQEPGPQTPPTDTWTDAMEARPLSFHRKVRELFLNLPADYPGHVLVVDARGPVEHVQRQVWEILERGTF